MKKSEKRFNKKIKSVISLVGFLLCTLLLVYPLISDKWNQYRDKQIIDSYIEEINNGDPQFYENELQKARNYNRVLYLEGRNIVNQSEYAPDEYYETLLNVTGTGIMCYVEIPKIDVTEPVYHYSTDLSLEQGVGHIHGSSLPAGGVNTHSVLTGHRGLPSQKIFSDLDRIETGDNFYIHILGHTFAYCVCNIKVVTPDDVSDLLIESNRDIITLVTCEPYGVNTHRLLVTGERVDFDESNVENGLVTTEEHKTIIDPAFVIFVGFMIFVILFAAIIAVRKILAKRKETPKAAKDKTKHRKTRIDKEDKRRRKKAVAYTEPEQSYSTPAVTENVYAAEEQPRSKHGPFFYIMLGIAIGSAVIGGIVIVYNIIKKRKNKKSDD